MSGKKETVNRNHHNHYGIKDFLADVYTFFSFSPRRIGSYFVRGLIIILPLAVTLWVIGWLFNQIDGLLSPVLDLALGRHIPGLSFGIILVSIILIGYLGLKIGQRRFFGAIEHRIIRIPFIGAIYGGIREMLNAFNPKNNDKILEVVLIEFPRKGIYAIGFVTRVTNGQNGNKVFNVFIPTAPTPAGGYLQIVPESEITHTSMSVSDAMKFIISIGGISKEDFSSRMAQPLDMKKEADLLTTK
jgi:uncharacterized membrane protein